MIPILSPILTVTMTSDFLQPYQARIDAKLNDLFTSASPAPALQQAMVYASLGGGKRLRASLVYLGCEALSLDLSVGDSAAIAVELMHAYSLIHDDLPAMDDDDLRRGQPSTHIKFGEATAILAGDALQSLAFETLAKDELLAEGTRIKLITGLAHRAGHQGMAGGQSLDMAAEDQSLTGEALIQVHRLKTGALIEFAASAGAVIHDQATTRRHPLATFGRDIGLAFQVQDDILDEVSSTEVLGKIQGSDRSQQKSTFVSLFGLEGAQEHLDQLLVNATEALTRSGLGTTNLLALIEFVGNRKY